MAVGAKIKRIRNLRGLTLKELGMAVGFDEKTADIRIAQYESGTRTPKEELLRKISEALDVNYRTLYDPSKYAAEDIMFTLFELDEHYTQMQIYDVVDEYDPVFPTEHKAIGFHSNLLDEFLAEWQIRKQELSGGIITREEYMEWKINWPDTCDGCGEYKPIKQWKNSNESNEV